MTSSVRISLAYPSVVAILLILLLVNQTAEAQKVHIDYARDFDFKAVKTFTYVNTEESNAANPMMAGRIEAMIKNEMKEVGVTEVTENPDIFVTYHIITEERTVYDTTSFGYGGYGVGWGGYDGYGYGGMGFSTTTSSSYTNGTLIIDAYDAKDKKMIWRVTGTVTAKAKAEKQIKQVEKILTKIGPKWERILGGYNCCLAGTCEC